MREALKGFFTESELATAMRMQLPKLGEATMQGYATYERKLFTFLEGRGIHHDPLLRSFDEATRVIILTQWLSELRDTGVHTGAVAALRRYFLQNKEVAEFFDSPEVRAVRENLRPTDREVYERRKMSTKVAASKEFVEIQELLHSDEGWRV